MVIPMVRNQGKGRAVRLGVERSKGEFILVTDATCLSLSKI